MYAGKIVEEAKTQDLFSDPKHPYTKALINLSEMRKDKNGEFYSIDGMVGFTQK